jgi:hypothetical protein
MDIYIYIYIYIYIGEKMDIRNVFGGLRRREKIGNFLSNNLNTDIIKQVYTYIYTLCICKFVYGNILLYLFINFFIK